MAFVDGAWRLEGGNVGLGDDVDWAEGACEHGLRQAEAWPLHGDLQVLRSFVRQFDDPDCVALERLVGGFFRQRGEVGELRPLALDVDERHERALQGLEQRLVACPAPHLVDSDTGVAFGRASSIDWETGSPIPRGYVLIAAPPPGPPYSYWTPFDAKGIRVEQDGIVFRARRAAQEPGDRRSRLEDQDTGASIEIDGAIAYRTGPIGKPVYVRPTHFHVEQRTFPADFVANAREDLATLVRAALETGHPIRFPARFG